MIDRLAVVIVGYDSAAVIRSCVDGARALSGVTEIVVVDHGDDGTAVVAEAAGARVLRCPGNPGFGAGQNRGVRETDAPYVLLLNPDAVVDPDGIAAGLAVLVADGTVAAVQGCIVNRATGATERSQGRELGPVHLYGRALGLKRWLRLAPVRAVARRVGAVADHAERIPDGPQRVESLAATAVLVRRAAFEAVDGFDESYFLYGEDLDLCRRLRRAGWSLVAVPDRFAVHESGASAANRVARELTWWRGTMQFAATWWPEARWRAAVGAAVVQAGLLALRHPTRAGQAWREIVVAPVRARGQGQKRSRAALAHPWP